jgi:hypothetical protein
VEAGRTLPTAHIFAKNRLTQYMGPASAYGAVLRSIDEDVASLLQAHPRSSRSTKSKKASSTFATFRPLASSPSPAAAPFYRLHSGRLDVMGQRIQVNEPYRVQCVEAMDELVAKL